MKNTYMCSDCAHLYQKMQQQEETIAQLVEIIGVTNRRVYDLDQRQLGMAHELIRERQPRFVTSSTS
ncbi:hypothetical protein [Halobacillus amylolyticus]|uniref:Uncharacterized protein n=1 Tax=Halobacillus amylolyticus TaxID=2932259 RepID=A0ABY4HBB0_9BACI|nr:hypothetical protein [Halobacillus amylolyticus]UOR11683.1 hypothetical protein MUO15_19265 [Halobacillus amylolyticus]